MHVYINLRSCINQMIKILSKHQPEEIHIVHYRAERVNDCPSNGSNLIC